MTSLYIHHCILLIYWSYFGICYYKFRYSVCKKQEALFYTVVCKTWAGLIGLGSILGWAQFWAGLDFGLGSIDYRVI